MAIQAANIMQPIQWTGGPNEHQANPNNPIVSSGAAYKISFNKEIISDLLKSHSLNKSQNSLVSGATP